MTWRSPIFFSCRLFSCRLFSSRLFSSRLVRRALGGIVIAISLRAATVSGVVELRNSRLDSVNKRKDYSGVVISLQPVVSLPAVSQAAVSQAIGDAPPASPAKHAVMLQKNKMFTPHILPVLTGTMVDFPNADPIFHNAFSRYDGQIFDVGLYPPGTSRSVRFARAGAVRVFCNIHPAMSAVILVLTTPYFTTTGRSGTFELNVPAGTYDLNVFHERATEHTLQMLSHRVIVGGQPVELDPIVVSEAGQLIAPHKNKYGVDYGAPPDDQTVYPGVRN
jgi:plastocyanin